jgi:hypothetical protein
LVFPGAGTECSTSSYLKNAYHIFPHGCVLWRAGVGLNLNHNGPLYGRGWLGDHNWLHYKGNSLVEWELMPVPQWNCDLFHRPCTGNVVETDDAAISFPTGIERGAVWYRRRGDTQQERITRPSGAEDEDFTPPGGFNQKWISRDTNLARWQLDGTIDWPVPPGSGVRPINCFTFRHDGEWFTLGAYECYPGLGGRVELYRATDDSFNRWEYVGEFYRGSTHIVHHPHLFFVGDKVVMSSAAGHIDNDVEYVLGRIENNKFVREGGGFYRFGRQKRSILASAGQTITEPGGRVVRWHMLGCNAAPNALANDLVRRGWQHGYTIPHVVRLRGNTLAFDPAPDLEQLRFREIIRERNLSVPVGGTRFPKQSGNRAHIEVRCAFKPAKDATAGIVLKGAEKDQISFSYDAPTCKLSLDFSQANVAWKAPLETGLTLGPDEDVELRLFYDGCFVEVYANGQRAFNSWYPDSPRDVQIGFFSNGAETVITEAGVWEMGAIWKKYMSQ